MMSHNVKSPSRENGGDDALNSEAQGGSRCYRACARSVMAAQAKARYGLLDAELAAWQRDDAAH
jgi:hypothetical protein